MNVSPEKTEPELFPNWPNQPNHLNVSREISQNVKQAQELEATNALDGIFLDGIDVFMRC